MTDQTDGETHVAAHFDDQAHKISMEHGSHGVLSNISRSHIRIRKKLLRCSEYRICRRARVAYQRMRTKIVFCAACRQQLVRRLYPIAVD